MIDMLKRLRLLLAVCTAALALAAPPALAQASGDFDPPTSPTTSTPKKAKPTQAGKEGDAGKGLATALASIATMQSGIVSAGIDLSQSTRSEANKIAFALGVITIVFAGLRFAGTPSPVAAWTDFLETMTILGLFSTIYISYSSFGPGIVKWFQLIASQINGGNVYDTPTTLATTGGKFWDAWGRAITDADGISETIKAVFSAIPLLGAFVAVLFAAIIYTFFLNIGDLQVAIGLVLGPVAIALGFFDLTRRYFTAWLDFMVTGSMYVVVAAIIGKLVSTTLDSALAKVNGIGTDTWMAAIYVLCISVYLCFVALQIPSIAGSIFGTGGGMSGGGGGTAMMRGAWGLGKKLAGK